MQFRMINSLAVRVLQHAVTYSANSFLCILKPNSHALYLNYN
jgi:hypothetical protein